MATRFFLRSRYLLKNESSQKPVIWIAITAVLLGAWTIWLFVGNVGTWIKSKDARVQVDTFVVPLESPVTERIASVHIELGDRVKKGDTLIVLEHTALQRTLAKEEQQLEQINRSIEATNRRLNAVSKAQGKELRADAIGLEEEQRNLAEAISHATFAKSRAQRLQESSEAGSVSAIELDQAISEAKAAQQRVEGLEKKIARTQQRNQGTEGRTVAEQEELRGQYASLQAEASTTENRILSLHEEIRRRIIQAPTDGKIGEVFNVAPGSVLEANTAFGSIVPEGDLKITAHFDPASAWGRVQVGQQANLSFTGFSRIEYGTIPVEVTAVAHAVREQGWRVELQLLPNTETTIPLQHGLEGSVEVCVERISPATLLLRLVGGIIE